MFLLSQLLHAAFKPVELGRQPSVSKPPTRCKRTSSNSGLQRLDLGAVDSWLMYPSGKKVHRKHQETRADPPTVTFNVSYWIRSFQLTRTPVLRPPIDCGISSTSLASNEPHALQSVKQPWLKRARKTTKIFPLDNYYPVQPTAPSNSSFPVQLLRKC